MFLNLTATKIKRRKRRLTSTKPYRPKHIKKRHFSIANVVHIVLYSSLFPFLISVLFFSYKFAYSSEFFNLQEINVLGNHIVNRQEIIQNAALLYGENIFNIDLEKSRAMIRRNSYIKQVAIRRELPSTIVIELSERQPIAAIPLGERTFLVSDDGMLLEEFSSQNSVQYPLIIDTENEAPTVGNIIKNSHFHEALAILTLMKLDTPECYSRLISIKIENPYRVLMTMRDIAGKVIIRTDETAESLFRLRELLPKLSNTSFKYIDLRFKDKAIIKLAS